MNHILIYFAIKYKGHWDSIYKALDVKEKVSLSDLQNLERQLKNKEVECITILDLDYPQQLKQAYKPPFVIFYKGDKSLLRSKFMCASGDETNDIEINRIKKSVPEIEKNHLLVSALYKGIDEIVFNTARKTVMLVSANGLVNSYFAQDEFKKDVLIISEYPNGTNVSKDRLRARNRIIAAFAESLILYSSNKDGGIMNLVSNFLNLGKEVYAYPGNGSSNDGNSELIKTGANLITSIKDMNR